MRSYEYHRTPDEPFRSRWIRSHRLVRSPVAISTGFEYRLHHSSRARVRPRVHDIVGELDGQPAAFVDEEVRELLFDVHLRLRDGLLVLTTACILTGKRAPWGRAHDPAQGLAITNRFAAESEETCRENLEALHKADEDKQPITQPQLDIEEEFPDLFVYKGRGLTVQLLHYAVYAGAGSCSGRMVKLVLQAGADRSWTPYKTL